MSNSEICPHCGMDVEEGQKFCHNCGKPLIVGIDEIPEFGSISEEKLASFSIEQLDILSLLSSSQEKEESLITLNYDQELADIDSKIYDGQESGEEVGELLLEKAALYFINRDLQNASKMFETALENFKSLGDLEKTALVYNDLGLIYEELGYLDDSLNNYEKAMNIFQRSRDNLNYVKVLNNLGNVYLLLENIEKAYDFYSNALEISRQNGFFMEYRQTSSNLIEVYFRLQNFTRAYKFLTENIQFFRNQNDIIGEIIATSKFGKLYYLLGENYFKLANGYMNNAQILLDAIREKISDYDAALLSWENYRLLGLINLVWNDNTLSKKYLNQALDSIRTFKMGPRPEEALVLVDLANFFYINGNDKEALHYFQQAEAIYKDRGEETKEADIKTNIGNIYFSILDSCDTAINYFELALDLYSRNNYLKETAEIYEKLADVYEKIDTPDSALIHLGNALKIYETLNNEEKQNQIKERIQKIS